MEERLALTGITRVVADGVEVTADWVEGRLVEFLDEDGIVRFRLREPVAWDSQTEGGPSLSPGTYRVKWNGTELEVETRFDGSWVTGVERVAPVYLDPTFEVVEACSVKADCDDHDDCTVDACVMGECDHRNTCEPVDSCYGYCGTYSPYGCWCDSYCVIAGDCCYDSCYWCGHCGGGDPSSCAGKCGGYNSYAGCYCDSACVSYGDCCYDACQQCGYCYVQCYYDWQCDDYNACTNNYCWGNQCVYQGITCNDGNVCTDDWCHSGIGCQYSANSAACTDGNACTLTDYCSGGWCYGTNPKNCNDNNVCTSEYCNTANGACVYSNLTTACNDGNACTVNDYCSGGSCWSGTPMNCNDNNVCTNDSCSGGVCSNVANSIACNDGNACTKTDTCVNKSCVGTPYSCNDNLTCTSDACNGSGGCTNTLIGGNCLIAGVCYANGAVNPSNSCQACITGTSTTAWSPRTGVACTDGNACTYSDLCNSSGVCAGTGYSCNDGKACTTDSCNGAGGCNYALQAGYCDIGNVCYTNGTSNPSNNCQQCATATSTTTWTAKSNGTSYGTCSTGMLGDCGAGKYMCSGGQYYCVPNVSDYGVMTTVTVPAGLLERSTGNVVGGHQLITSDGRYLYNLAYGRGAAYNGYRYRQFDPRNGFAQVAQRDSGTVSFYADGAVVDAPYSGGRHTGTGYLYPIEWTGGIGRIDRIVVSNGTLVANVGQVPQGSPVSMINGQWDWVLDKVFMGSLYASNVARWAHGATWAPTAPSATTSNWEASATNGSIAGAGVVASDGTYLYVKRWATYPGDDILRRVGTGSGGTTFGAFYGHASNGSTTNSLSMTYMPDGYVYNPRSGDPYTLERVRVTASKWEICDGKDNDCDGFTDEDFPTKGQACDGSDADLCAYGTFTCKADGTGVECVNESPANVPEICDLVDNDCDGLTDEGFNLGAACDGPDPDLCSDDGVIVCNLANGSTKCEDRGPTTYFPFDEGNGTLTRDFSGNGKNGTLVGNTAWTTTAKYGGQALYFDGASDYVEFSSGGIDTRRGSLAMWVRPDFNGGDATAYGMFQTNSGVNNAGWISMFKWTGNIFYFRISATGDCCVNDVTFAPSGYLVSGTWVHLAATWDQTSNAIRVYANGTLVASKTSGINWNIPVTAALSRVGVGHDAWMRGRIDDVGIYSYALTQAEIQTLMNSSVEAKYKDLEICDGVDNNCTGGIDEGFDKGTACSAGVGQCAVAGTKVCLAPGFTTVCSVTDGKVSGTACDDGGLCTYPDRCTGGPSSSCVGTPYTCNDGLTCTADTCNGNGTCTFTVTTGCAISGVCYAEGAVNPSNQCQACVSATSKTAWTNKTNGTLCNADNNGCTTNDSCQSGTCTAGAAQACADAYSCTNNVCTSTGTNTYSCSNPFIAGQCLYGGACAVQGTTLCDSTEDVDLCTDDGVVMCSGGTGSCANQGPITYFPFDEGNGTIAYDFAGNGNNGTLTGSVARTTTAKFGGQALTFDGGVGYTQFPSTGIKPTSGTVSVWLRPGFAGTNGTAYGVFQTQNGVNNPGWISLFKWTSNIFYFRIVPNAGCCGNDLTFAPGAYLVSGTWVHLAATWDQAGDFMRVYMNGSLVASRSGVNWAIAAPNAVSRFGQGHDAYWLGQMDDAAVYGYALTQAEIQSVMNSSVDAKFKDFEACDNVDNDCDGVTDEGWDKGVACTVGTGACANTGVKVCNANGIGTTCSVTFKPNGTACDDGNACTNDSCQGGVCTGVAKAAGTVCRASAGGCDPAETCNGTTAQCPADAKSAAGTVCRASAGACDVAETCNGTAVACPADTFLANTVVCRAAVAGGCDVEEKCTGTSAACPADVVQANGTVCRASAGACDVAETCNGVANTCPTNAFASSATVCRNSGGVCDPEEKCTGSAAACPADLKSASGTVCRPSAGPCDVAETCNGTANTCPTDAFQANTLVCRPSGGVCDPEEKCTGSAAACPVDAKSANGTVCRASAGVCDVAETCNGTANTCPTDAFVANTVTCRPSGGVCDIEEKCSGTTAACPADAKVANGSVCRASAGVCDVAETCNGTAVTCPADAFVANTTVCRPSGGVCDIEEKCTGTTAACPADAKVANGSVCRASAGVCDVAETCNGTAVTCPADAFLANTTVCRPSGGVCDIEEKCTGSAAACPVDAKVASGSVCRASAGVCDVAETCNGTAVTCPADAFLANSTVCRPSGGVCDIEEKCTGSTAACPADAKVASGSVCRASAGVCDVAETCNGTAVTCPTDVFVANTTVCRPAVAGGCDVEEKCTGSAALCPTDVVRPSGTVCRASAGVCDLVETCNGSANTCPVDAYAPTSTVCRPAATQCDVAENCSGSGVSCPADALKANGTSCDADGSGCTVNDTCQTGSCTAGAAPNCADAYTCTTDACVSTGASSYSCSHTVNNGTCLIGTSCYNDNATNGANQCQRCWSATSKTAWSDKPNGTACNDGSACTSPDTCTAGTCGGPADPQIGQACDGPDADACTDGIKVCSGTSVVCADDGASVYLKLDEGTGTTAADWAGNANNGTRVNGSAWGEGVYGKAATLDGVDDYIQIPYAASLAPIDSVSVSMWIKPNAGTDCNTTAGVNNWRWLLGQGATATTFNLIYEENQSVTWTVNLQSGGTQRLFSGTNSVPESVWSHMVFTYSGATGKLRTYRNGVLLLESTVPTGVLTTSTNPVRIGNWSNTVACPTGSGSFGGQIDEVAIYNRELSAADAVTLFTGLVPGQLANSERCNGIDDDCDGLTDEGYSNIGVACDTTADADLCSDMVRACTVDELSVVCPDGPLGAWTFPENGGALAKDSGGGGFDLSLMNGTAWAAGKQGTALSFDGVDDYAWHPGWAKFAGFSQQSISVWIRPTASTGDQHIISSSGHNDGNGCCWRWRMWRSADRLIRFALWDGDNSDIVSSVVAPDNAWTHVVVTFKVGGVDRIYVNGVPSGTVNTITSNSAFGYLHLGAYYWNGTAQGLFKGQIDEVSVFTQELTRDQVAALYSKGRVPPEQINFEYCDGLDNDCKNGADDGHVFGPCDGPDSDLCLNGQLGCTTNLLTTVCGAESPTNIVELCNGADDDCDGLTDELWPTLGQTCDGPDSDQCKNGLVVCATTTTVTCGTESPANITEKCNNIDDDCDGQTDEDFPLKGQTCDGSDSDQCKNGTYTCTTNGAGVECVNESVTNITEKCNGIDDDCDGSTDEDFATLGQSCDGPDSDQCKNGVLVCNGAQTGVTCGPESPANIVEICNGLDDDCDAQTDEGFNLGASCDSADPDSCSEGVIVCKPDASGAMCAGEPVVYLKLDEGTGATAFDSSSYGNHAAFNGATWAAGQSGGAAQFAGAQWLEIANGTSNKVTGPGITMMAWVYWSGVTGSNIIVNKESTYEAGVNNGTFQCAVATSGGSWFWSGTAAVPANTWTHVACTHGPDNQIRTYVGGVLKTTQANTGNGTIVTNNNVVQVGRRVAGSFFNGRLDEVAIFDHALTGARIAQIFSSGLPASKNYEYCDGVDNDCNGQTDELFATKGQSCDGSDADLCKNGTFTCATSQIIVECVNESVTNIVDKCNGVDDDCDGSTDEDFPTKGQACDGSDSDQCKNGTFTCTANGATVECVNETVTNIAEVCNGADDDCDGATDEGFDVGAACTMGVGTCEAAATKVCKADGTGTVCQGNGKPAGAACDDSNACTKTDVCSGGPSSSCAGVPYTCNDNLACTTDSCNGDGTCTFAINAGSCSIGGVCYADGAQNPANECQVCAAATTNTAWSNKLNGTACNKDSNGCTFRDSCQAGTCVAGAVPSCSDGISCTSDVCTSTGANTYTCSNPPVAGQCVIGAITKVDASAFTGASGSCTATTGSAPLGLTCTGGGCTSGCSTASRFDYAMTTVAGRNYDVVAKVADYLHNCTNKIKVGLYKDGVLVSMWDGAGTNDWSYPKWSFTATAASTTVSIKLENDACCSCSSVCSPTCVPLAGDINLYVDTLTLVDTSVGPCWANNVVNPANQCQTCSTASSQTAWTNKTNGTACDADGSGCTVGDSCQSGSCAAGPAPDCGDGFGCTTDVCNTTGATTYSCSSTIDAGKCLIAGVCYANGDTDPGNQCKQCTAATSQVAFSNKSNGSACNDGSACTAPDTCTAGVCAGPDIPSIGQACDGADADLCTEGVVLCKLDKSGTVCSDGAGLVFRFEEGSGTSAIDTSGNGRNGSIQGTGNGTTSYGPGKNGAFGINFAFSPSFPGGTTVTRVRVPPAGLTSWKMTFAAWVYPDVDGSRYIVSRTSTNGNTGLEISAYGAIDFAGGLISGGSSTHVMRLPLNTWSHLAVTYDGVTFRAYRDGVERLNKPVTVNEATTTWNSDIWLGQDQDSPNGGLSASQAFSGTLDDVVWYERPLSASEIVALMNTGVPAADINHELCDGLDNDCDTLTDEGWSALGNACDGDDGDLCSDGSLICAPSGLATTCRNDGPVGAWTFSEQTGTTAHDASGSGNHAALSGALWTTLGGRTAVDLDGVDDAVTAPHSASLAIAGPASLEAWVWIDALPPAGWGFAGIVAKGDLPRNYSLYLTSAGFLHFSTSGINPGGATPHCGSASTAKPPLGQWVHLAAVNRGPLTQTHEYYINGVAAGVSPLGGECVFPMPTSTAPVTIGRTGEPNRWLDGKVDLVAIYDRALSAAEIAARASSGIPALQLNEDLCDGADNDCDGLTDEAFADLAQSCDGPDSDQCKNGVMICTTSQWATVCGPETPANIAEKCNALDDDCDGQTDEDFPLKGQSCDGADTDLCKNGTYTCTVAGTGVECVNETLTNITEKCNGLDDDCDGLTDENWPTKGQACDGADTDQCKNGTFTCKADGSNLECVNETVSNIVEACNGADDDCDGLTDETWAELGDPCDGSDADQCKNGSFTCKSNGSGTECVNESVTNIAETCNGQDDDCDGSVDEDFPTKGQACDGGDDDQCKDGLFTCKANGTGVECVTDGPVAFYRFEEGSGATAASASGSVGVAALTAATWTTAGPTGYGKAIVLNGTTAYGAVPHHATLDATTDLTLAAWVKWGGNGHTYQHIVDKGNGTAWTMFVVGATGELFIKLNNSQWKVGTVPQGAWAHVAATFKSTSGTTGTVVGYLDGVQKISVTAPFGALGTTTQPMHIGSAGAGINVWKGNLDEVAVYRKVLTPVKIAALFGQGEACNGVDDDCDGQTDETFANKGAACDGADTDQCKNGTFTCAPSLVVLECVNETVTNIAETCNGVDDDCDGLTDEDFAWSGIVVGSACDGTGECGAGVVQCKTTTSATCSTNPDGTASQAVAEKCNGKDDDCDGLTDEDFTYTQQNGTVRAKGQSCDGVGECGIGVVECASLAAATCSTDPNGSASQAVSEICDGKDNDCDAATDEGFVYTQENGQQKALGQACDGIGECGMGTVHCNPGKTAATCSTNPDGTNDQSQIELCDGLDNSCNGMTDEGFVYQGQPIGGPCDGVGACGVGTVECFNASNARCSTEPGGSQSQSVPETCNGADDDCDGETDEASPGVPLTQACYTGPNGTIDVGLCKGGTATCSGGTYGACVGQVLPKPSDTICDGKDEDCDGQKDEDYAPVACGTGVCANTSACVSGAVVACAPKPQTGDDTDCDGLDDDCDGQTDEAFIPTTYGLGVCACQSTCVSGSEIACTPSSPPLAQDTTCNGQDDDCDGQTDESFTDGIACTVDVCVAGEGTSTPNHAACNDSEACTDDACSIAAGGCVHTPDDSNAPNPAADDGNPCTDLVCQGGTSKNVIDDSNVPDDGKSCTADTCSGGVASHAIIDGNCFIDGDCWAPGDVNPSSGCEVCAPLTSPAAWTNGVFSESFSAGTLGKMTSTKLSGSLLGWQADTKRSVSPAHSAYFGDPINHNYDKGRVRARLESPALALAGGVMHRLRFHIWMETEMFAGSTDYDALVVRVRSVDGSVDQEVWNSTEALIGSTGGVWRKIDVNLDPATFGGQSVTLRFEFDSGDGAYNQFEGVYLDDITVGTACCFTSGDCEDGDTCTEDFCAAGSCDFTYLCDPSCVPASNNVVLVLDRSASMNTADGAMTRWEWATDAVDLTAAVYAPVMNVGLKVFPTSGACSSSAGLDVPFHATQAQISTFLAGATPTSGSNPMAQALAAAGAQLQTLAYSNAHSTIVLITDGGAGCTESPSRVAVIEQLAAAGVNTIVVGYGYGSGDVATLNAMAIAGGLPKPRTSPSDTWFYAATSPSALVGILDTALSVVSGERCDGSDDDCDGDVDEQVAARACNPDCGIGGKQQCASGGWGVCSVVPEPEVCDGQDNDCDGLVDEDWYPDTNGNALGGLCSKGVGECLAWGNWVCNGASPAGPAVCSAATIAPKAETCNNKDDNCNGVVDDGLVKTCSTACGTGTETCAAGLWVNCTAPPVLPEVCNNIDDDCDGVTDEGPTGTPLQKACATACGTGVESCLAGQWKNCTAQQPYAELCNNADDDCDGQTDEGLDGFALTEPCYSGGSGSSGIGNCHGGTRTCSGAVWGPCMDEQVPVPEICDGEDNDCDGVADEGPDGGALTKECNEGPGQGICQTGISICELAAWTECIGSVQPQPEQCDGLDNDCDGQTDENAGTTFCQGQPGCYNGNCKCGKDFFGNYKCYLD
ncbi:MAG: hypothetical protein AMXMBFR64_48420 [Myxococcales bacterium]